MSGEKKTIGALATGLLAVLALAAWNALHGALVSRLYREDPSRAAELFLLSLAVYASFILVPLAILLLALRARAPRTPAGADERIALHAGVATGLAALFFAVGLLAPRGPHLFLRSVPAWLDGSIAAGAAVGSGFAARRLVIALRRSETAARLAHFALALIVALPISLLLWVSTRDRWSGPAASARGIAIAAAAAAAGLLSGFLLVGAVRWTRGALRRFGRRGTAMTALILAVALLVAAAGPDRLSPPGPAAGAPAPLRPNVVFIVADTLRADHVGCYGAARARTPALDALAARGARVEKVYASASWTCPATASLLTGLYAGSHGLLTYQDRLSEETVSIATVLREAGYRTAGISANPVLSSKFGFGEGFDSWDEEISPSRLQRHSSSPLHATLVALHLFHPPESFPAGSEVVRRALSWLDRNGNDPFFLYLHFMDPHDPYSPPPPFDTMYGHPEEARWRMRFGTLPAIMEGKIPVEAQDLDRLQALYDGAISSMDDQIGRFLLELESRGMARNTLVVFTSDHGEEFNDHGGLGHEHTLYEELVRIPLIVAGPGVEGNRTIEGSVRSIDVAPTILEAAGLRFEKPVEGASLWAAFSRGAALQPSEIFMEESYIGIRNPYHRFLSLRQGNLKIIGSTFHIEGQGPWRWELYDLASDPAERRNLASTRPADATAMAGRLDEWAQRPRAKRTGRVPVDEDLREKLRALGYVQ